MTNIADDPIFMEALFFLSKFEEKFLELGALLRKLQKNNPEAFKILYSLPQLGRRKAFYLSSIDRAFGGYPHLRERLIKVGWTRLSLVAPHVGKENVEDAVLYCELNSCWAIEQALKGKELPIGIRSVLLHFSSAQFDVFVQEIVKYGAMKNGDGYVNKETAVIGALMKASGSEIPSD
jgi:hypothetical protein